jgi:hypothetical protein
MNWNGCRRKWSWSNAGECCLKGLRVTWIIFRQMIIDDLRPRLRKLPLECESKVLPFKPASFYNPCKSVDTFACALKQFKELEGLLLCT